MPEDHGFRPKPAPELPPWAQTNADILLFPSAASAPARNHALPRGWNKSIKQGRNDQQLKAVVDALGELAFGLPCRNERETFGELVGAADLAKHPVHRWYSYKEAFSPRLPVEVVERLGAGDSGVVADPFAGVATTALALQHRADVDRVVGVEYSPFAHFAGKSKLGWAQVSPEALRSSAARLARFRTRKDIEAPELAAFSNDEIFKPSDVTQLLSAREAIKNDPGLGASERAILLLGLASIVEFASGARKDGRALRILRGRRNTSRRALRPETGAAIGDGVRELLLNQWLAMAQDLESVGSFRKAAQNRKDRHLKGDARDLEGVDRRGLRTHPLPPGGVGLSIFSPPYLNCIDYTEVYKLELWMLEFVETQQEFRDVRLGTLRSHPSVRFPERGYFDGISDPAIEAIRQIETLMEDQLPKPGLGLMARGYFEDMLRTFRELHRVIEPGGHAVCVVANSTFSKRSRSKDGWDEIWRLPVLTDVLLARLALTAGFEHVELWEARDLQPKNVRSGYARESLVVARKSSTRAS